MDEDEDEEHAWAKIAVRKSLKQAYEYLARRFAEEASWIKVPATRKPSPAQRKAWAAERAAWKAAQAKREMGEPD